MYRRTALLSSTRFRVAPKAITYIGHLRVSISSSRFGIHVVDREQDARAHLAQQYPKYQSNFPFRKELAELRVGT